MSQKDFTDYNGQKRKAILYPPPERELHYGKKPKKWVSFKTKCDRYKAALKEFREWWDRKRKADARREHFFGKEWYHGIVRGRIKRIRKLQKEYKAEGILERVKMAR